MACAPDCAIEAVLFDFGGVFTGSPFHAVRESDHLGEHDPEVMIEIVFGPYDRDTDHPWHRVERGEIPIAEWVTEVTRDAEAAGVELDFGRLSEFLATAEVRHEMVAEARALRAAGYRTALVTNNVREASGAWRAMLPLDELFDVVVDSSDVGMRKPDERIFLLALERLGGIDPSRAIFLDDHPGNVAGAERAGLVAILVGDPEAAVAELRELVADDPATSPPPPAEA